MPSMHSISYCIRELSQSAVDFIAPVERYNSQQYTYADSAEALVEQHHLALSNCLAQSRLLAFGNEALDQAGWQKLAGL